MSILVLGTAALDTVATPSGKRREMLGGSAIHFSMAARLFTQVNLVAVVGRDFPKKHIQFLRDKGIQLSSLAVEDGKTFRWEGEYRGDLNTALTLSTELGVLSTFRPRITDDQRYIANVFLANVDPDIQASLLSRMCKPRLVGLDSMNYWIDHKRKSLIALLKRVHIFVANDAEARSLTGETNLIKAAKALRKMGPPMVVVKKGEHGVFVYCDDFLPRGLKISFGRLGIPPKEPRASARVGSIFCLPAYPIEKIIDPTGAGDSFAGGFMGYLAQAKSLKGKIVKKAVAYGTIIASFNVEGFGVERSCRITHRDVESRLKDFKEMMSF